MKKNKMTEFFKGKGYYVLLFVGVIAIAAVAYVGSRMSPNSNDGGEDFVDLNDTDNNIAANDDNNDMELADNDLAEGEIANNEQGGSFDEASTKDNEANEVADGSLLEYEDENDVKSADLAQAEEPKTTATQDTKPEETAKEGSTVQANTSNVLPKLSFQQDSGLLWPVDGNVIMKYSMDHTIYFATLMTYKCNPAIIIDAEVDTVVKAAAKGIITNIEDTAETGLTVTTTIGDGFSLVYGQLKDVNFNVGDKLNAGQVIGKVSAPTKYYSVEGSNVYFQVLNNDQTVDPMLYLQ